MAARSRYVALLRGINVGGNRRVAMADLKSVVEGLGHTEVRTHLNSGNVVLTAGPAVGSGDDLARGIERAIEAELGMRIDVLVRSRRELAAVVRRDPLGEVATNRSRYLVVFLSAKPSAAKVAEIDPAAYEPERFAVHGKELYLWMPEGVRDSRVSKAFDRLGPVATSRNWNTVARLLELLDE